MFALSIFILAMPFIGFKPILKLMFFPDNTSIIRVSVNTPNGTSLKDTDKLVRQISKELAEKGKGYVLNVSSQSGMLVGVDLKPQTSSQYGFMQVQLPLKQDRAFSDAKKFIQEIRRDLEEKYEKNGTKLIIEASKDGPPVGLPLNIRISGLQDDKIMIAVNDIMAYIRDESQKV